MRCDICRISVRYGGLEDLIGLSVEHNELRTLLRVLHAAGPKGQEALLQLCERMKTAADDKAAGELLKAGEHGNPDRAMEEEGQVFARMTAEHLFQLLYRSYLSLGISDAAGKMLTNTR